jgi:hypothetical protein
VWGTNFCVVNGFGSIECCGIWAVITGWIRTAVLSVAVTYDTWYILFKFVDWSSRWSIRTDWRHLLYMRSLFMNYCCILETRVNEQRNILREIRKRKANWIGHILRRNCLLKQVIEGKIKGEMDVTRRRGRRRKKLLDDLKDRRGYSHLKEEALDRTMWRNRFGGGFGPVVRQTTE